MKEEKKIEFTQKWIGDAVKKFLQKEDICESDMERIRYMRIGDCDFGGEYTIEISTATPPSAPQTAGTSGQRAAELM